MSNQPNPIPFNKPFIAGKELYYVAQAVTFGNLSGDGHFTKKCARFMEERFSIPKVLMTPSCTASLEMAAQLCDVGPGDEVIMPSYTFVSTASAFVRMGAKPVFVDIRPDTLNIDEQLIEKAITPRTKAICVVHYAGVACEMDTIMDIAKRHKLKVVEDAAQGVNSWYKGRALGSIGDLGCYSFHETKNFICGEGGALCINDTGLTQRAEIIRDKGTNRQRFFRGEVDKYTWVEVGSSYVPSELCSAFLYAQLEEMEHITTKRERIYRQYLEQLSPLAQKGRLQLPSIPTECQSNYHLFFAIVPSFEMREGILEQMRTQGVRAAFHYVPLHNSPKGLELVGPLSLPVTEDLSARLVRMPLYFTMDDLEQDRAIATFLNSFENVDHR
jgi:dTDP-4-amino-4,6-dideoxygalactose transaminase